MSSTRNGQTGKSSEVRVFARKKALWGLKECKQKGVLTSSQKIAALTRRELKYIKENEGN